MGLTLTLTDEEIPASLSFIEFLYAALTDEAYHVGEWYAQENENLIHRQDQFKDINNKAAFVLAHPEGKTLVLRAYRYFKEMLTGRPDTLRNITKFHFYFIIGIPRTGGTYLTKQLFRANQIDYTTVQNALAHDGFPHLTPLGFKHQRNMHTNGLLQLAEYLTMVELYFTRHGKLTYQGGIVVPKKLTKAIYNFPLIQALFDTNATYLITLRHPLPMAQSTLEKSGGMPDTKKFVVRSSIERWAMEDWLRWGESEISVKEKSYVDAMLGYWKRYHYHLALAGIPLMRSAKLIPFGKAPMEQAVSELFNAFNVTLKPEPFNQAMPQEFSKKDIEKADTTVHEVAALWKSLDLAFPLTAISAME